MNLNSFLLDEKCLFLGGLSQIGCYWGLDHATAVGGSLRCVTAVKKHPAMTTSFIWLIAKGESDDEAAARCCQKPFPGIRPQMGLDPPLQRDSIKRFWHPSKIELITKDRTYTWCEINIIIAPLGIFWWNCSMNFCNPIGICAVVIDKVNTTEGMSTFPFVRWEIWICHWCLMFIQR